MGAGHDIALVVTQPDRRRARGAGLLPTPVKAAALELGLAVTDRVDDALDAGAELGVVVAFGRLIKPHVLAKLPMVNLHFSLLPRWRGAAPVERAILAGDTETGVCLMALEEGLDTGPVYACQRVTIGPEETAEELRDRLVEIGTAMLVERLAEGPAGRALLRVMDWVGNRPHGVVLRYSYFSRASWRAACDAARLATAAEGSLDDLYPFPFSAAFGRDLHFIARLERVS